MELSLTNTKAGEVVTDPALIAFLDNAAKSKKPETSFTEIQIKETQFKKGNPKEELAKIGLKYPLAKSLMTKVFQLPSDKLGLMQVGPNKWVDANLITVSPAIDKILQQNGVVGLYFDKLNTTKVKFTAYKFVNYEGDDVQLVKFVCELNYIDFRGKRRNHEELFMMFMNNLLQQ